jgi:hypothetical protein
MSLRHLLLYLGFYLFPMAIVAQVPEAFKYQAVARDASGITLVNSPISIRASIVDQSTTGSTLYSEIHNAITNDFGLFSLEIGSGTIESGDFTSIDWSTNAKFIRIEADFSGGTTFDDLGIAQLLSVPYALYAKNAGNGTFPNGVTEGNTIFWNGSNWVVDNNNLFNNGSRVGIGTSAPLQKLDVRGHITIPIDSAYMINNKSVLNTKGQYNLHLGVNAAASNTFGQYNVIAGFNSGAANTVGNQNVFIGAESGESNLDGAMNTFAGRRAGKINSSGNENTFIGCYAGQNNTIGDHNSFLGVTTGNSNTTGEENTFLGAHAGYFNTTGSNNTYVGNFAGQYSTTGSNNVFIGFNADALTSTLTNAIAIGSGTIVNASNQTIIGNTSMTSIGGQVGWSTFSDRRLKKNITPETLGLDFILDLNPVRYEYKAEGQSGIVYSGLIAQEVELSAANLNTTFSGVVRPQNEDNHYSLRYSEFVIPLIKAIQEQNQKIEELEEKIKQLKEN